MKPVYIGFKILAVLFYYLYNRGRAKATRGFSIMLYTYIVDLDDSNNDLEARTIENIVEIAFIVASCEPHFQDYFFHW